MPRFMDLHDGFGGVTREQLKDAQAADWAGRMNSSGRAIVLVPNKG